MVDEKTINLIKKLDTNIKNWYIKEYSSDEVGMTLSDNVSFLDLNNLLNSGKGDVYSLLGGDADTIVRERVFEKLAEITEVSYDDIYYRWINLKDDDLKNEINNNAKGEDIEV